MRLFVSRAQCDLGSVNSVSGALIQMIPLCHATAVDNPPSTQKDPKVKPLQHYHAERNDFANRHEHMKTTSVPSSPLSQIQSGSAIAEACDPGALRSLFWPMPISRRQQGLIKKIREWSGAEYADSSASLHRPNSLSTLWTCLTQHCTRGRERLLHDCVLASQAPTGDHWFPCGHFWPLFLRVYTIRRRPDSMVSVRF
ncbi:hypothetical protein OE88DRAFT_1665266 [Heliocybe sulcata]|uniref:Uncharacterized protein n=1 Tax=Heliocybe sulcata TaxID=5364 RepID=A0A5C3MV78_9AGAM|nr:hypothetical protein OE88DRAFT_1665266 [Heliocybe sulcata]